MARAKATKTYEVTGQQAVLGRARGEQLTSADFADPAQEVRLLESGAIALVEQAPPVPSPAPTPTPAPGSTAGQNPKE